MGLALSSQSQIMSERALWAQHLDNFQGAKLYPLMSQQIIIRALIDTTLCAKHWRQGGEPGGHAPVFVGSQSHATLHWNDIKNSHWLNVYWELSTGLHNLYALTCLIFITVTEWFLLLSPLHRRGKEEDQLSTLPWDTGYKSGTRILMFSAFSVTSPQPH